MEIPAKNFVIYSASAGSGKTFTLVSAYLQKILEPGGAFSKVLAITFTNKATAEMKARIIAELANLSEGKESAHLPALLSTLKEEEKAIRAKAGLQLKKLLHDYSNFSVSTIDSYFQVLTRTLTRELKIPVKFDLELNEERVRHEIAARVLARAGYDHDLTVWLRDLLFDKLEQGKGWKIQPELRKLTSEVLHKDEARILMQSANREKIRSLITELYSIRNRFIEDLRSIAKEAMDQIATHNYTLQDFSYNSAGAAGYFEKLLGDDASKWEGKVRVSNAIEDPLTFLAGANRKKPEMVTFVSEILHPLLDQAVEIYRSGIKSYNSAEAVRRLIYYTGIIPAIGEELKKFRDEQQVFLLSDTTRLLAENVAGQDAPFIFEKSGIRFRHVFIDEFQDTATQQWNILLPLAKNSLSNGDQLLLVGDAKQSIYRWRGGNIHLLRRIAEQNLHQYRSVLDKKMLDTNWRSGENIVEFNNAFFPLLSKTINGQFEKLSDEELKESYMTEAVHQKFTGKNKSRGYVEFTFYKPADKKKPREEDDADAENGNWKERALVQLKQTLEEVHKSGFRLQDVAILFRTNAEEAILANYLLGNTKFPFISSNSLKLNTHPGIRFLINCLTILAGEDQPVNRSEAEEFLILKKLQKSNSELPHARIRKFETGTWFREVLLPLKEQAALLPVHFLVSLLREKGNLTDADPFLDAFEDLISEYAGKYAGGAADFLTWWEEQLETKEHYLDMPESVEAIRMLSIHKSKGLEFPVVILPFCDWKILPDFRTRLWTQSDVPPFNSIEYLQVAATQTLENSVFEADYIKECKESLSDNLNVTYVAFTRPKERLYVFSTAEGRKDSMATHIRESVQSISNFELESSEVMEIYTLGTKPVTERQSERTKETLNETTLYSPKSVSGSRPVIKAALNTPEFAAAVQSKEIAFGKALHEVIAFSTTLESSVTEIQKAAMKFGVSTEELTAATAGVMQLLEGQGWLSPSWKIFPEADFSDGNGAVFRPDRILTSEKETVVLDFKTGAPSSEYAQQVQGYCNLLSNTGLPAVKGYLVYPASGIIHPVN